MARKYDKYGYYLEPDIETYRRCAYRFQSLKDEETPTRLGLAVGSYFVGKLRFGASFYYLRSTSKQLDTVRFYYAMALSAVLGLSTYETMGASCCRNMAVSESNISFKRLLHLTGLPSLREQHPSSRRGHGARTARTRRAHGARCFLVHGASPRAYEVLT